MCLDLRSFVYFEIGNSNYVEVFMRDFWSHQMSLSPGWLILRLISDKVQRLFFTLSYFRPYRIVQLLNLIPILMLLLNLLVSIDLVYTEICEIRYQELFWRRTTV